MPKKKKHKRIRKGRRLPDNDTELARSKSIVCTLARRNYPVRNHQNNFIVVEVPQFLDQVQAFRNLDEPWYRWLVATSFYKNSQFSLQYSIWCRKGLNATVVIRSLHGEPWYRLSTYLWKNIKYQILGCTKRRNSPNGTSVNRLQIKYTTCTE